MKLSLTLDYTLPEGTLAPYFDALRAGRALASCCKDCGRACFPARVRCGACGADGLAWVELTGRARVVLRTDAAAASFAIVRFDGADGATLVGLSNPGHRTETGKLVAPKGDWPGLRLELDEGNASDV